MLRAICSTWLCTASARDSFSLTVMRAPTRSRYRPRFFENDTAMSASGSALGDRAERRPHPPSRVGAESLVGQVEKRGEPPAQQQLRRAPATDSWPRSAPVGLWQQACTSTTSPGAARSSRSSIASKRSSRAPGIVVGIALELESRAAEQRDVVAPGRIAHVHRGRRRRRADELGADAQRAASAGRLRGARAPRRGAPHARRRARAPPRRSLNSSRPAAAT